MRRITVVTMHNTMIELILVTLKKMNNVQSIVHKHSQRVDNSRFWVELLQVRCVGVTCTLGDMNISLLMRIVISSFQPPRQIVRRQCNSA